MAQEDVGGVRMQADLDTGPLRQSTKLVATEFDKMVQSAQIVENHLNGIEGAAGSAVGSLSQLKAEAQRYREELEKLDPETKAFIDKANDLNRVLERVAEVEKLAAGATKQHSDAMDKGTVASRAFSIALGIAGVQSVDMLLRRMLELG